MGSRLKVLGGFAILGFLLGVMSYFTYELVLPRLIDMFPGMLKAAWFYWGLIGSVATVSILLLWATVSQFR